MNAHFPSHPFFEKVAPDAFWCWMARQRWFGGKARPLLEWNVSEIRETDFGTLAAIRVTYADGAETYVLPLAWASAPSEHATILQLDSQSLCDASESRAFQSWLFRSLERTPALDRVFAKDEIPPSQMLTSEQSNTSFIFGGKVFVKWYRRLTDGINPDEELTRFLSEQTDFPNAPKFLGALRWAKATIALATALTPNQGDAWQLAHTSIARASEWGALASLLGRRTAELHHALAGGTTLDFSPEPLTSHDLAELRAEIARLDSANRTALTERLGSLPHATATLATRYLSAPLHIPQPTGWAGAAKFRTHGDLHLGQVLWTGSDFIFIDFEGEPSRSLAQRRAKRSPLRDVAGMLRSFHYAAFSAKLDASSADIWGEKSCSAFLDAWKATAPTLAAGLPLLDLLIQEKALYELSYELNNRPDWLHIPLRSLC